MPSFSLKTSQDFAMAAAKGKGCSAQIAIEGVEDVRSVFLGGSGVATFSNAPGPLARYSSDGEANLFAVTPETIDRPGVVALDWITNHFVGRSEEFGRIDVQWQTITNSTERSSAVVMSEGPNGLFPASVLNLLFFEMELSRLGVTMFNKEPLVLRSTSTHTLQRSDILNDTRYQQNHGGLPSNLTTLLNEPAPPLFDPLGTHVMQAPLRLYYKHAPASVGATILSATVQSVIHFGIDLSLKNSHVNETEIAAEIEVVNLTNQQQTLVWHADGWNNAFVDSQNTGEFVLAAAGSEHGANQTVRVTAKRRDTQRSFGPFDFLFFAVTNTPEDIGGLVSNRLSLSVQVEA